MNAAFAWYPDAACLTVGPELFFAPEDKHNAQTHAYKLTRQVCAGCPVWRECRVTGIAEEHGMFGGLTPDQRRPLRKNPLASLLGTHPRASTDPINHLRHVMVNQWAKSGSVDRLLVDMPSLDNRLLHHYDLADSDSIRGSNDQQIDVA